MTQHTRVAFEIAALLILGALIAWNWPQLSFELDGNSIWYALFALLLAFGGLYGYQWLRARERLAADIGLLQAAAQLLIKEMENYPVHAASRRARGRGTTLERFALKAAEAGRALPMGDAGTLDLSTVGLELVERNEKDSSGHWRRVNGIRRGAQVFHSLFTMGNATAAFLVLTDHMKIQARQDPGQVPNHTELKMLFGLPIEHPEVGLAERYESAGLHWRREQEILHAVSHKAVIFKGLFYHPFPFVDGEATPTYWNDDILKEMREYMR